MNKCETFKWKQKAYREQMQFACIVHNEETFEFKGYRTAFNNHLQKLNAKHKDNNFAVEVI